MQWWGRPTFRQWTSRADIGKFLFLTTKKRKQHFSHQTGTTSSTPCPSAYVTRRHVRAHDGHFAPWSHQDTVDGASAVFPDGDARLQPLDDLIKLKFQVTEAFRGHWRTPLQDAPADVVVKGCPVMRQTQERRSQC